MCRVSPTVHFLALLRWTGRSFCFPGCWLASALSLRDLASRAGVFTAYKASQVLGRVRLPGGFRNETHLDREGERVGL